LTSVADSTRSACAKFRSLASFCEYASEPLRKRRRSKPPALIRLLRACVGFAYVGFGPHARAGAISHRSFLTSPHGVKPGGDRAERFCSRSGRYRIESAGCAFFFDGGAVWQINEIKHANVSRSRRSSSSRSPRRQQVVSLTICLSSLRARARPGSLDFQGSVIEAALDSGSIVGGDQNSPFMSWSWNCAKAHPAHSTGWPFSTRGYPAFN
jgi:hypothetical protein